jgi:RimJ/RimL family protein N-acetyltransferase
MSVTLRPVSAEAAQAIRAGRPPGGVRVAADYPTEFSHEVGEQGAGDPALGPFFIHRAGDDVVVGEIGATPVEPGVVMTGYAIVASCWGRGHATDAVRALVESVRAAPGVARIVALTPLDRPASGRVLEKAGFALTAELDHEHDGQAMRVRRWELEL